MYNLILLMILFIASDCGNKKEGSGSSSNGTEIDSGVENSDDGGNSENKSDAEDIDSGVESGDNGVNNEFDEDEDEDVESFVTPPESVVGEDDVASNVDFDENEEDDNDVVNKEETEDIVEGEKGDEVEGEEVKDEGDNNDVVDKEGTEGTVEGEKGDEVEGEEVKDEVKEEEEKEKEIVRSPLKWKFIEKEGEAYSELVSSSPKLEKVVGDEKLKSFNKIIQIKPILELDEVKAFRSEVSMVSLYRLYEGVEERLYNFEETDFLTGVEKPLSKSGKYYVKVKYKDENENEPFKYVQFLANIDKGKVGDLKIIKYHGKYISKFPLCINAEYLKLEMNPEVLDSQFLQKYPSLNVTFNRKEKVLTPNQPLEFPIEDPYEKSEEDRHSRVKFKTLTVSTNESFGGEKIISERIMIGLPSVVLGYENQKIDMALYTQFFNQNKASGAPAHPYSLPFIPSTLTVLGVPSADEVIMYENEHEFLTSIGDGKYKFPIALKENQKITFPKNSNIKGDYDVYMYPFIYRGVSEIPKINLEINSKAIDTSKDRIQLDVSYGDNIYIYPPQGGRGIFDLKYIYTNGSIKSKGIDVLQEKNFSYLKNEDLHHTFYLNNPLKYLLIYAEYTGGSSGRTAGRVMVIELLNKGE